MSPDANRKARSRRQIRRWRDELDCRLKSIPTRTGVTSARSSTVPRIYKEVRGVAPDLIVYFGDLYWRSVGTVGGGKLHTFENDTGPDGANHAQNGMILWRPAGGTPGSRQLRRQNNGRGADGSGDFGPAIPQDMEGKPLVS